VPDPNGPPVLSYQSKSLIKRTAQLTVTGTLGAGVTVAAILVVGAVLVTPTLGASRSHRITWEQRQQEIAAAAEAEASSVENPPALGKETASYAKLTAAVAATELNAKKGCLPRGVKSP